MKSECFIVFILERIADQIIKFSSFFSPFFLLDRIDLICLNITSILQIFWK